MTWLWRRLSSLWCWFWRAGGSSSHHESQSDPPEVFSNDVRMEVISHDGELIESFRVHISANGHDPERSNDGTHGT